jgi:hypothetical protein
MQSALKAGHANGFAIRADQADFFAGRKTDSLVDFMTFFIRFDCKAPPTKMCGAKHSAHNTIIV